MRANGGSVIALSSRDIPVSAGARVSEFSGVFESMHAQMPLHGDDGALDWLQKTDGQAKRQRQPKRQMDPIRRRKLSLDVERHWNHHVAHNENDEIRGKVVGPMMMKFLATYRAAIVNLQERAEDATLPAARAPAKKAPCEVGRQRSRRLGIGHDYLSHTSSIECTHTIVYIMPTFNSTTGHMYGLGPYTQ